MVKTTRVLFYAKELGHVVKTISPRPLFSIASVVILSATRLSVFSPPARPVVDTSHRRRLTSPAATRMDTTTGLVYSPRRASRIATLGATSRPPRPRPLLLVAMRPSLATS